MLLGSRIKWPNIYASATVFRLKMLRLLGRAFYVLLVTGLSATRTYSFTVLANTTAPCLGRSMRYTSGSTTYVVSEYRSTTSLPEVYEVTVTLPPVTQTIYGATTVLYHDLEQCRV